MAYNVAHFLAEQARIAPSQIAVRAPQGRDSQGAIVYTSRSFAQLEADASAAAHFFLAEGIRRGTRVLLLVKLGLDLIRIVFALFKMGAVPIVIDPGMGLKRFLRCVRHTRPEVLLGTPTAVLVARLFRPSFRGVAIKLWVGRNFGRQLASYQCCGTFSVVDSRANELAAILFTSGSTGPAKGVCYEHGMFLAQVNAIRSQYQIEPGEVDLPMLPVFALFNPALGMCTVVPEMNPSRPATVDAEKIVRAIQQNKVTSSFGSPALWTKIARYCHTRKLTLPSIRRILMAGAPVPPGLMQQMKSIVPNGEIHSPYGATEALPISSISASQVVQETAILTQAGEGTCLGLPLEGVDVRIIESVDGVIARLDLVVEQAQRQVGEIIVCGPTVTRVYDQLPAADLSSKIFDDNTHWHRMGDLGWLDGEGRLWFCGRKAEQVLSPAGPLYTDCCEAIFNQHSQVFRSALIDSGGGHPAIVVEPELGHFPSSDSQRVKFIKELRSCAQGNVKTASIKDFFFERNLPVDVRHNAKIHRLSLARKFGAS